MLLSAHLSFVPIEKPVFAISRSAIGQCTSVDSNGLPCSIVGRQPLIFQLLTVFQIYQRTILMQFLRRMRCTRLDSHNISTAKTAKKLVSVCTKAQRPLPPPRIKQKFDFVQFRISNNQEAHALPFLLKMWKNHRKAAFAA